MLGLRTTLQFVACSGATTQSAIAIGNDSTYGEKSQFAALNAKTGLVTLTLGGNDLNFSGIAETCVTPAKTEWDCINPDDRLLARLGYVTSGNSDGLFKPSTPDPSKWNCPGNADSAKTLHPVPGPTAPRFAHHALASDTLQSSLGLMGCINDHLDVYQRLVIFYRTIHALAPNARILVLGYPRFFPKSAPAVEHFSSQEAAWINDRIMLADEVIHAAAAASGVALYVDEYNALHDHELGTGPPDFTVKGMGDVSCNGGAYINGVALADSAILHLRFGKAPSPESLHPNPCGHQAEAAILLQAYQSSSQTSPPFTPPSLPPEARISVKAHHGNFPFGCHATFEAKVDSRSQAIQSLEWYDETGNLRGTGSELEMDSVHNAFKLYLRTIGYGQDDRYSFFDSKSVC